MREVEVLLEENMLSIYKKPTPIPYNTEEKEDMPMAAEESLPF